MDHSIIARDWVQIDFGSDIPMPLDESTELDFTNLSETQTRPGTPLDWEVVSNPSTEKKDPEPTEAGIRIWNKGDFHLTPPKAESPRIIQQAAKADPAAVRPLIAGVPPHICNKRSQHGNQGPISRLPQPSADVLRAQPRLQRRSLRENHEQKSQTRLGQPGSRIAGNKTHVQKEESQRPKQQDPWNYGGRLVTRGPSPPTIQPPSPLQRFPEVFQRGKFGDEKR